MFLVCTNKATPSRDQAVSSPLYWALFGLQLEFCVQIWSSLWKIDMGRVMGAQSCPKMWSEEWEACYIREGWENCSAFREGSYAETLCSDHVSVFKKVATKEEIYFLWGVMLKRQGIMDVSDRRGKFFTIRTIIHWNNPPRKVVDSPKLTLLRLS